MKQKKKNKVIFLVYQDCYKCEWRKAWFEDQQDFATKNHIIIEPLSYLKAEGKELIFAAKEAGYPSMPFFTDGEEFSYSVRNFVKRKKEAKKDEALNEPTEEVTSPES